MGTAGPHYDARNRQFASPDPKQPFVFRTVPQRFAPYVAMQVTGADPRLFGPHDVVSGDEQRSFRVPLHKPFPGRECLHRLDPTLSLASHLVNEKLKRMHLFQREQGYPTEWTGTDLDAFPFSLRGDSIASLLPAQQANSSGVPIPQPRVYRPGAQSRDPHDIQKVLVQIPST
ncbi:hypothetical protein AQI88_00445 [Streptomyces cellostaticus]|uniref:Uncharacterized protein n=2 Tax=Streptomyces cellostaticus TaxID=67285 RepID=A0A124HDV6_9ACTN|nr:hypothetical protein AQI88_00445 [Streptomyces cellostaticus]GHI03455.1 hypothetical protein Scel_17760 [Streptomyces cellostaticus]